MNVYFNFCSVGMDEISDSLGMVFKVCQTICCLFNSSFTAFWRVWLFVMQLWLFYISIWSFISIHVCMMWLGVCWLFDQCYCVNQTQHNVCDNSSTWLILPVVICLSRRLSHACLSVNILQWNCGWLITTVIVCLGNLSTDIRGNSTVNTFTLWKRCGILLWKWRG